MKCKVNSSLAIMFLIIMSWQIQEEVRAQDEPQDASPPIDVELRSYIELATETKEDVIEQISFIESIPENVKNAVALGEKHLQELVEAANNNDLAAARRSFQKVMRAFIKVSDYIVTSQNGESEIPEARLDAATIKLYDRMQKRVEKLKKADSKRSLGADFRQIERSISRAERAVSRGEIERLRSNLIELKEAIILVEDYISEQLSLIPID